MCGIAGYRGPKKLINERINQCLDLMTKRGPDNQECILKKHKKINTYLLHSRLSIIDLNKRSNQPYNENGNLLSFNGEIYNFLEISKKLKKYSNYHNKISDTEILSHLLVQKGISSLNECEGMFAISWLNGNDLYLARDRFGEKPLYYFIDDDAGVYFGSEIKFIFTLLGKKLPINYNQVFRYLVNGYKSLYKKGENFFSGIKEVKPGSYIKFEGDDNNNIEFFYWNPTTKINPDISFEEAVKGTKERLIKSVELRLRSDVPISFCLSGGIDSNALISIAKNILDFNVHGFTIINTDERYQEKDLVNYVVKKLKIKHTEVSINKKNFLQNLKEQIKYHDAPVFTISYYAHWQLMKQISNEGYKVSISGTGADELFSGYYDHHNAYLAEIKDLNSELYNLSVKNWTNYIKPIVRNPYLKDPNYFVNNLDSRKHIYLDAEIFSNFLKKSFIEPFTEELFSKSFLKNRMLNELFYESVPVILHEDDLNSMYYSVENRSPFLDGNLYEWSQSLPTEHLIKDGFAKAILRESVRGIVPSKIIDKHEKIGFNIPILDYLDLEDKDVKNQLLSDSPVFEIIEKKEIHNMLSAKNYSNSKSKFLFNFINAKLFLEEFL